MFRVGYGKKIYNFYARWRGEKIIHNMCCHGAVASEAWASELFTMVTAVTVVSQSMMVRNKMQTETPERSA